MRFNLDRIGFIIVFFLIHYFNSKIVNSGGIILPEVIFKVSLKIDQYGLTLLKIDTAMIVTCVYIHVKPESVKRFIEVTAANHRESVKESGNLRFDLVQQVDDPCKFMLYEAYESEIAVADHKNTVYYLNCRELAEDMMAEPRHWVRYNIIEPKERSEW